MRWDEVTEESMTLLSPSLETVRGCIARKVGRPGLMVRSKSYEARIWTRQRKSRDPCGPRLGVACWKTGYLISWMPIEPWVMSWPGTIGPDVT